MQEPWILSYYLQGHSYIYNDELSEPVCTHSMSTVYLQEASVSPNRQVKLWCICDEQYVAVYMDGWSNWSEEEGEDVTRLVWVDEDGCAEVLHLKQREK